MKNLFATMFKGVGIFLLAVFAALFVGGLAKEFIMLAGYETLANYVSVGVYAIALLAGGYKIEKLNART